MTAQDVIDRFRVIVKDDIEPYRIPDAEIFPWLSDAVQQFKFRRPDYVIDTDFTYQTVADITAATDTINYPDRTRELLSMYVAYRSYVSEDADRHNATLATNMMTRYEMLLQTV